MNFYVLLLNGLLILLIYVASKFLTIFLKSLYFFHRSTERSQIQSSLVKRRAFLLLLRIRSLHCGADAVLFRPAGLAAVRSPEKGKFGRLSAQMHAKRRLRLHPVLQNLVRRNILLKF